MPTRPRRRCPQCKTLHEGKGLCNNCRTKADKARGSAAARGYDKEHQELFRAEVLRRNPLCVICLTNGQATPAVVADHYPLSRRELQAQGMDPNDPDHGRGLCTRCHNQATATNQPGGWHRG